MLQSGAWSVRCRAVQWEETFLSLCLFAWHIKHLSSSVCAPAQCVELYQLHSLIASLTDRQRVATFYLCLHHLLRLSVRKFGYRHCCNILAYRQFTCEFEHIQRLWFSTSSVSSVNPHVSCFCFITILTLWLDFYLTPSVKSSQVNNDHRKQAWKIILKINITTDSFYVIETSLYFGKW